MRPIDPRLLRATRATRGFLAASVALGLAGALLVVAQAVLLAEVITSAFLGGADTDRLLWALGLLAATATGRALVSWLTELAAHRAGAAVKSELRMRLLRRAAELPAGKGESRPSTGELTTLATRGVDALDDYFARYLPQLGLAAVVPVAVLLVIVTEDWISAATILVTLPLIPIFMVLIGWATQAHMDRQWRSLARLSGHFLDVVGGLTTLKVFGRAKAQAENIRAITGEYRRATLKTLRIAFLSSFALELIATVSVALVAVGIGMRLVHGELDLHTGLVVLILAPEAYLPLRQVGTQYHAAAEGLSAADEVFAVLEAERPEPGTAAAPDVRTAALALAGVTVRYPGRSADAVRGFSLTLAPGETVALTGPSGAGKSTVLHAALGLLRPDEGRVLLGGRPLDEIEPASWHRQLAWVPQHPGLFAGTVADNVRLARPDADDAAVAGALHAAAAADLDPDRVLGEGGSGLSQGQRQRLALARAFLADRPLLLLDEPTAALDGGTEAAVVQAVRRLAAGRTVLLVTHRPALLPLADRTVELSPVPSAPDGTAAAAAREPGGPAAPGEPADPGEWILGPGAPDGPDPAADPAAGGTPGGRADGPPPGERADRSPAAPPRAGRRLAAWRERRRRFAGLLWPAGADADTDTDTVTDTDTDTDTGPGTRRARARRRRRGPRYRLALATIFGALALLCAVGLMAASGWLISRAAEQPPLLYLMVAVTATRAFGIGRAVFRYCERLLSHDAVLRVLAELRVGVYRRLERLAPAGLRTTRRGDLLARLVGDVDALQDYFLRWLLPAAVAATVSVAAVAFTGWLLPAAGAALAAGLLAAGVAVPLLAAGLARRTERRLAPARGALAARTVDLLTGTAELTVAGALPGRLAAVAESDRELTAIARRAAAANALGSGLVAWCTGLTVTAAAWLGVAAVAGGGLTGVWLATVVLIPLAAFEAVAGLPQAVRHRQRSLRAAERVREVLDAPEPVREPAQPAPAPASPFPVRLSQLTVRHPGQPAPALSGVDLELAPGRRIAVVGPSGAGKTTLAHALLRLIDPESGEYRLGGTDATALDGDAVRRAIGLCAQDAHLFDSTLRENLLLASPGADDARLRAALRRARLLSWAEALPEGLDTPVGEEGARLSGGQRQRLALARALLADFPVLILDEPAEHLDLATADALTADLLAATEGRTTVLITHRLAHLAGDAVDEVLVLDGGRLVQRGGYAELAAAEGGPFHRMLHPDGRPAADGREAAAVGAGAGPGRSAG